MVMMEVSDKEEAPPSLPLSTFSAPFAAPSLRWPAKKRLRCFSPDVPSASSPLRSSPSRSPLRRISPAHDGVVIGKCTAASSEASPPSQQQQDAASRLQGSPLPPRSPTPSDRPRVMIRLRKARREGSPRDEDWEPPPPPPPPTDLSSAAPTGIARGGEGDAAGRTLRSSSRLAGEEEEKTGKRKRRVELWVTLSKVEVEEDFLRMTGYKPPRRCRLGRRKAVPDYLSGIFPGSWLPNRITADWYKVAEPSNLKEVQVQSQGIEG